IDPDGVVQASELNADGIRRDASTFAHKIKQSQSVRKNPTEISPAKWEEGTKALQPGLGLGGRIEGGITTMFNA
ncbi:hypothetical protein EIH00_16000, partial [Staphylococcus aureus]